VGRLSGFDHRAAAITAVTCTEAAFESTAGMPEWIRDLDPDLTGLPDSPTVDTHAAWEEFTKEVIWSIAGRPP
jgi:hypothetical protein